MSNGFQSGGPVGGPGLIWRPRLTPAQRLPVSADPACSGLADPTFFDTFQGLVRVAGGTRGKLLAGPVPGGFYWWTRNHTLISTDPNSQGLDFYLVDPLSVPIVLGQISAAAFVTPGGCYKIAPSSGNANEVSFDQFRSQAGRAASTQSQESTIIVPSGWALLVVEINGVVSGIDHDLILRMIRAVLKNGAPPPF